MDPGFPALCTHRAYVLRNAACRSLRKHRDGQGGCRPPALQAHMRPKTMAPPARLHRTRPSLPTHTHRETRMPRRRPPAIMKTLLQLSVKLIPDLIARLAQRVRAPHHPHHQPHPPQTKKPPTNQTTRPHPDPLPLPRGTVIRSSGASPETSVRHVPGLLRSGRCGSPTRTTDRRRSGHVSGNTDYPPSRP